MDLHPPQTFLAGLEQVAQSFPAANVG